MRTVERLTAALPPPGPPPTSNRHQYPQRLCGCALELQGRHVSLISIVAKDKQCQRQAHVGWTLDHLLGRSCSVLGIDARAAHSQPLGQRPNVVKPTSMPLAVCHCRTTKRLVVPKCRTCRTAGHGGPVRHAGGHGVRRRGGLQRGCCKGGAVLLLLLVRICYPVAVQPHGTAGKLITNTLTSCASDPAQHMLPTERCQTPFARYHAINAYRS